MWHLTILAVAIAVILVILWFAWKELRGEKAPDASVGVQAPATGLVVTTSAPGPQPGKESYCPKLMHKYGMCNAGATETYAPDQLFKMHSAGPTTNYEPLVGPRASVGTFYDGYMYRSVMPTNEKTFADMQTAEIQ